VAARGGARIVWLPTVSLRFFVDETVHRFHTYGTPPVG
jgi:hypothetical protein